MFLNINFESLSNFTESSKQFFNQIWAVIKDIGLSDIFDILLVAFVIFQAIKLVRDTRALQLFKGLFLLFVLYFFISLFNMQASSYILNFFFKDLVIVLIVLFHPEIRNALENIGKSRLSKLPFLGKGDQQSDAEQIRSAILSICRSSEILSKEKIGALIVFERETLLSDVISTGTVLDAKISKELIGNVFYPKSPLHDGAAVVRNGKLYAAGCILPLSKNPSIASELGTRHRAAIGMSEQSDAVVVVVSEETGAISFAKKGHLERNISDEVLHNKLIAALLPETTKKDKKHFKK